VFRTALPTWLLNWSCFCGNNVGGEKNQRKKLHRTTLQTIAVDKQFISCSVYLSLNFPSAIAVAIQLGLREAARETLL
jgi:hypothetical protein